MPTYEWCVLPQTHRPGNLVILKILFQTEAKTLHTRTLKNG